MATVHARNVPDHLHEWLKKSAEANGVSLTNQIVRVFQDSFEQERKRERFRKALARIQDEVPAEARSKGLPDSLELLREDRAR